MTMAISAMENSHHYHYRDTRNTHKRNPVAIGAPYVLCVFAVGVILMGVGTFVTSHAYEETPQDMALVIIGFALLAIGGMLLIASMIVCAVACCKNRRLRSSCDEEIFNIGSSTFYGGHGLIRFNEEADLDDLPPMHYRRNDMRGEGGFTNPTGPMTNDHDEAVRILANTVAEERVRQRQYSQKLSRKWPHYSPFEGNPDSEDPSLMNPLNARDLALIDHLGLERLRRADPYPELAEDFDLEDETYSTPRNRAYSMSIRKPAAAVAPIPHRLRRNFTHTPALRARLQQQQKQPQQNQQQPAQQEHRMMKQHLQKQQHLHLANSSPQRKRSSKRKKGSRTKDDAENVTVHRLPRFDPDLLNALGINQDRPQLRRGTSEDPALDQRQRHFDHARAHQGHPLDAEVAHGSLGNPRRRSSMAMGVRGLTQTHSGAAYRHRSTIYASDMNLHQGPVGAGARNKNNSAQTGSYSGSDSDTRMRGSSPSLAFRRGDSPIAASRGDMTNSRGRFRENSKGDLLSSSGEYLSTSPRSSSPSPRRSPRPLSNISSESCCSECYGNADANSEGDYRGGYPGTDGHGRNIEESCHNHDNARMSGNEKDTAI